MARRRRRGTPSGPSGTASWAARDSTWRIRRLPLMARGGGGVEALGADGVDDVAEGAQRDGLLTEGRQHPLDVRGVGRRGADDEDAAGLVAAPVAVEEVGGAVQGDDRLAGTGAAGDLGDAAGAGPDRLVLVALDRRDDVAHPGAAAAGQRGHEGAVADDDEVGRRLGDHEVVLDADDVGALAAQHPPAQHAHRLDRGRAVERRGGRGAPVDDQRLVVVVADAEPPDVADLPLRAAVGVGLRRVVDVEAAEDEPLVLALQGVAPAGRVEDQGVALEEPGHLLLAGGADAVGTPPRQAVGLDEPGALAGLRELRVDEVHVGLFDGDLVSDEGRRRVRPAVRTGHTLRLASRVVGGLDVTATRVAAGRAATMGTSESSPAGWVRPSAVRLMARRAGRRVAAYRRRGLARATRGGRPGPRPGSGSGRRAAP